MKTPESKAQEIINLHYFGLYELTKKPIPGDVMIQAIECAVIDVRNTLRSLGNIEGQHSTIYEEEDFLLETIKCLKKIQ